MGLFLSNLHKVRFRLVLKYDLELQMKFPAGDMAEEFSLI